MFVKLALKSIAVRKGSVLLSVLAMTISIMVLLGVEHVRHQAKLSFANTVSGVDLIVGARTSNLNLLLYSVFRIGSPTNNISWHSFEMIAANPKVKWAVPLSLGDSHKGFRVLGTNQDFFKYVEYGQKHSLVFGQGHIFSDVYEVVLGSTVAAKLHYQLGDELVLAHGIAATSFSLHKDKPFTVVGILSPTGTPVDHTLHVSLQSIEAIHTDTSGSVNQQALLQPSHITAFMLGLESKITTFTIQRDINQFPSEPLIAILPGVVLSELWQMMGVLENTLLIVSLLVFLSACLGVCAMLLASVRERHYEIRLLQVIGAPAHFLFLLIAVEALFITLSSIIAAGLILTITLMVSQDYLMTQYGLNISTNIFTINSVYIITIMMIISIFIAIIPSLNISNRQY
jgi:putative ABC transport system permease protein